MVGVEVVGWFGRRRSARAQRLFHSTTARAAHHVRREARVVIHATPMSVAVVLCARVAVRVERVAVRRGAVAVALSFCSSFRSRRKTKEEGHVVERLNARVRAA